jgi:hypothetical protein
MTSAPDRNWIILARPRRGFTRFVCYASAPNELEALERSREQLEEQIRRTPSLQRIWVVQAASSRTFNRADFELSSREKALLSTEKRR